MQFFADRTEAIKGLAATSLYVEADGGAARDAYNGVVVTRDTLVVTLQATVEIVPKVSMLRLARLIDSRVK